jgi:hypothetical protein
MNSTTYSWNGRVHTNEISTHRKLNFVYVLQKWYFEG